MSAKNSSQPRRRRAAGQVAAICYRIGKSGIEFLLVQTGGGRWIFPKGNVEPGLTHAQSAALEAFEEAGVHGCMQADSFGRYTSLKRGVKGSVPVAVYAHLCEVTRLDPPQESNRNPTWCSVAKAKRRLHEGRGTSGGAELARVVDRALARIRAARSAPASDVAPAQKDAMQKVTFEAGAGPEVWSRLQIPEFVRRRELQRSTIQLAVDAYLGEVLRLNPPREPTLEMDQAWTQASGARAFSKKGTPKQLPN